MIEVEEEILKQIKNNNTEHLHSLSCLQKEAHNYHINIHETQKIAEKLYEMGYITYPRTDAIYAEAYLFTESTETLRFLFNSFNLNYIKSLTGVFPTFCPKSFSSHNLGLHNPIMPIVNNKNNIKKLNKDEKTIYSIICIRYIIQFMPDSKMLNFIENINDF
jgi:DNA topoisomerase-3